MFLKGTTLFLYKKLVRSFENYQEDTGSPGNFRSFETNFFSSFCFGTIYLILEFNYAKNQAFYSVRRNLKIRHVILTGQSISGAILIIQGHLQGQKVNFKVK